MQNSNHLTKKTNKQGIMLGIYDIIAVNLAYGVALWLRFDFKFSLIPRNYLMGWFKFIPIFAVLVVIVFIALRLYKSIWEYVSYSEMIRCFWACIILGVLEVMGTLLFTCRMPISFYLMGWILMFVVTAGIRLSYRAIRIGNRYFNLKDNSLEKVLIVGGGEAGRMLIREMFQQQPIQHRVVCIADDAVEKQGKYMDGIPVKGMIKDVPALVKKYDIDKVIIAIPSAKNMQRKAIIDSLKNVGCEISMLPRISSISGHDVSLDMLTQVCAEDLLGREPVIIYDEQVEKMLNGKTVLITGGGGSIGSELVRQVAMYNPTRLVIFDIYENGAYDIQQEIRRKHPEIVLETIIGSIRDEIMVRHVIKKYRPEIVYHAAAHKHVPLMEDVPCEAIKNNVAGTYYCAKAASDFGVKRFVLISTDKAVNPTNIMGASKRLCEMVVKHMNDKVNTEYVAVRFGNVLGSNGSVVPLFKKQIADGGPVTVTHPEITRFFMTVSEAVSLVLQAGVYAKGGELYVLDMGEPVKIDDLARNMIEFAGLRPDIDIEIKYTGLRPGEKLYEEILMDEEGLGRTENELIYIGRQSELPENFYEILNKLLQSAETNSDNIVEQVAAVVNTYIPRRDN